MGREWYSYLSPAKSIKRGGRGGGGRGGNGGRRDFRGGDPAAVAAAAGCMGTLFQLFDFHHYHFCLNQQQHDFSSSLYSDVQTSSLKGVEAPRNSLEVEGMFAHTASLASITEEIDEDEAIPMGFAMMTRTRNDSKLRVQVPSSSKMGRVGVGDDLCSSESSSSPGPRTPNLVARLMGLEALPDGASTPNNTTPRSSSSSSSQTHHLLRLRHQSSSGSRLTTASPRNSDVDGHHRLSLQISKENRLVIGDVELPRHSCSAISTSKRGMWRDGFDENKSPGHYARQVVKQAKENVLGRKFGVDITNRNEKSEKRRDEQLISLKTKESQNRTARIQNDSNPSENSMPSRSPRLRGVETKKKEAGTTNAKDLNHQPKPQSPLPTMSRFQSTLRNQDRREQRSYREERVNPRASQLRPKKATDSVAKKKDELFVRRASGDRRRAEKMRKEWKRPLLSSSSSDVVSVTVSGFLPLKKLEYSSPTSADDHVPHQQSRNEQKQPHLEVKAAAPARAAEPLKTTAAAATATQLSSYSSYNNTTFPTTAAVATSTSTGTGTGTRNDFKYITRILNHIGIDRNAPLSLTKWFSVTHPLNPSIFHDLEALYFSKDIGDRDEPTDHYVGLRCNRRLLFDLLDQILMDVMKPLAKIILKDSTGRRLVHGSQLVELVWRRIGSFPSSNCQVLEDIDTLVERDLPNWEREAFQDEVELIALELERDIMDSLVRDIVLSRKVE